MKKLIVFAILALSINAFAQTGRPSTRNEFKRFGFFQQLQDRIADQGLPGSKANAGQDQNQSDNLKSLKSGGLKIAYDSIYQWQWDTLSMTWKMGYRFVKFRYDRMFNEIGYTVQYSNGFSWGNQELTANIYDDYGNLIQNNSQYWNESGWENNGQTTYKYDSNNNKTSSLDQYWESFNWVNYLRDTYTYDEYQNMTSDLTQTWNGTNWENYSKNTFTYDSINNMIGQLVKAWTGSGWLSVYKATYNNTAFNEPNDIMVLYYNEGVWESSEKLTYSYDNLNNMTGYLYQIWDGLAWVKAQTNVLNLDDHNSVTSSITRVWDDAGMNVIYGDSTLYYYRPNTSGKSELMVPEKSISVYPNPSNGRINISATGRISSVDIYNMLGERVYSNYTFDQQKSNEIDLSGYDKGIYIVKILSENQIIAERIVIQ